MKAFINFYLIEFKLRSEITDVVVNNMCKQFLWKTPMNFSKPVRKQHQKQFSDDEDAIVYRE